MSVWALVVAAGRGVRAGLGMNKVFYPIRGMSALERSLRAVRDCGIFDGVAVVLSEEDMPLFRIKGLSRLADIAVEGGETRRESVFNGLCAMPAGVEIVAVHDAARPFASADVFRATVDSARLWGSGVISTPVTDTIKQMDPDTGDISTLRRDMLRAVQTPQTFSYPRLLHAHQRAAAENYPATDDAELFEHYESGVRLVTAPGAEKNKKLTLPSDFEEEGAMQAYRVGTGYDAHRLKEGRRLVLCGVEVPHVRGLDGHSDADVAVHALMDAILGALALGDIGMHFPDTDDAYAGISSLELLKRVWEMMREQKFTLSNADITIVAQRPKLAGYIPEMRENLCRVLAVDADCVNVKATTTEKMGFEGEEQGISAQAAVLLQRI